MVSHLVTGASLRAGKAVLGQSPSSGTASASNKQQGRGRLFMMRKGTIRGTIQLKRN